MSVARDVGSTKPKKKRVVKKAPPRVKAPAGDVASGGGYDFKPAKREARKRKVRQAQVKDTKSDADRGRGKAESQKNVAEARLKYLRRTSQPVTTLKRELEGKGLLAKGLKKVGETAGYTSTGGGPNVAISAGRKSTSGSWKPTGAAAITSPRLVSAKEAKGFGRAAKDFVNFPATAIPSVYVPLAGAVEAAHGRPQRIKKFAKDIEKHDPVYNVGAAAVEAAGGDSKTAKRNLKRAKKEASAHPGFAAIEVAGVKGTIGRAGGRVVKAPPRAPARVEGTSLVEKRVYSPDIIKRQREKATDRHKTRRAAKLHERAERTANDEDAVALHRKANRVDPTKMTDAQVRGRMDIRVAANEDVRRINRTEVTRAVDKAVKPARKGGAALSLVAQRITKADKADLKAYRDEIAAHFDDLPKSGKRANRQLRKAIDDVLADPKADMAQVEAATRRYREITAPLQKKLSDRGLLAEGQADKAALIPYAVRHMGAKHDAKPRPIEAMVERHEQAKDLAADAKDAATGARADLRKAQSTAGKASGLRRKPAPKRSVEVHLPTPRSKSTFKLPARALNAREKAVVDARLAEFQQAARGNIKTKRAALKDSEKASSKAAAQAKRATPKKYVPGIVDAAGEPLTAAQIRAHMAQHGVEEPAFLTQTPNMRGAKNFYVASDKAASLRSGRRTGEATRKGTFDAHPDTLPENAARAQGLVDATDHFTGTIDEFGYRKAGKLVTRNSKQEIEQVARDMQADSKGRPTGDLEFRAVRVNPWGASKQQLERLLDEVDSDSPTAAKAIADVIENAVKEDATGEGPWALVPKAGADQLQKHMQVQGSGALGKSAQLVNSSFRKTVLSTSPGWLLGNVTEAAMRTALAKAGPRSYMTYRRTIREYERQYGLDAAKEASARMVSGGHYTMADRTRHTDASQFEGTRIEGLARTMGAIWRSPGPKQAADAWHAWTTFVFGANRALESHFQMAQAGKLLRDSGLMDGKFLKTGHKAVEQAAKGLHNTSEQVAIARGVRRMYGKYNAFSPEGRTLIANYTPFVAWSLNALKFVVDVLPRDHPTVTAAIAASEIATEEWRKNKGLDLFIDERVPAFLQGSIPTKGGGKFRASRYTPFGAFGSPLETATGAVLPQLSGVLAAGKGEDWKGAKLRVHGKEANEIQRWGFAAQAFAEATIPALAVGRRVAKDGPSALNPVKAISGKKKIRRKKTGVSWDGGGGGVKWDDQSSGVKWDD